ncbi:hypothetical protein C1645_834838 [Glomus cerebriforme]|uniref:Uncharacterized protein n=1 Tax=Glomus cerebriforme TaxID=658196 RepID=A0A397SDI4_9GLOM|nr:hypothetical protein C1645_834838 [Glomus cerebriforme]
MNQTKPIRALRRTVGSRNVSSELSISKFQETEVQLRTPISKIWVFGFGSSGSDLTWILKIRTSALKFDLDFKVFFGAFHTSCMIANTNYHTPSSSFQIGLADSQPTLITHPDLDDDQDSQTFGSVDTIVISDHDDDMQSSLPFTPFSNTLYNPRKGNSYFLFEFDANSSDWFIYTNNYQFSPSIPSYKVSSHCKKPNDNFAISKCLTYFFKSQNSLPCFVQNKYFAHIQRLLLDKITALNNCCNSNSTNNRCTYTFIKFS